MADFVRVSLENGEWQQLINEWDNDLQEYGERLDDYAVGALPAVRPLAEQAQYPSAGVYAFREGDSYLGICQVNVARLPGYDDKVVRVRHIIHAPKFDFSDDLEIEDYVELLAGILDGVFRLSFNEMSAPYINFHFKSPVEKNFFEKLAAQLKKFPEFQDVQLRGSWLYIRKTQK